MSPRRAAATAMRVLHQLAHDPRTLGLIFVVPCVLLVLVKYVFQGQPIIFNAIEPMMLGVFPLTIMFLVTSIATLRERTTGTLDRLMTMPISKLDFVVGYAVAFTIVAAIQASLAAWVVIGLLSVPVAGGGLPMLVGAVLGGFLGTSLGLFVSAFAKTEFQAVQFLPALIFPQLLTCGLIIARDHMSTWLQTFSDYMPMTYSVDAMKRITTTSSWSNDLTRDFIIVIAFAVGALVLGAITIRRRD
jgi:ABC-2 type transport system permease protein